jgi:cytochrome c-type biogenesis protein CcmH/NrfG
VVAANPNDASGHYHLGHCYANRSMDDLAIGEYMRAIQLDPDDQASLAELKKLQR